MFATTIRVEMEVHVGMSKVLQRVFVPQSMMGYFVIVSTAINKQNGQEIREYFHNSKMQTNPKLPQPFNFQCRIVPYANICN